MSTATSVLDPNSRDSQFLALLPNIENTARFLCLRLDPEARDEAVAEVTASAFVAFTRLVDQERTHIATGGTLARYAVRQYFAGRRVGSPLNGHDVLSPYARRQNQFRIERLDHRDAQGMWREILVEDGTATPADLAASRIDVDAWLDGLPDRIRRIALMLAHGYSTSEVAIQFHISSGRVSQLRRKLARLWQEFHAGKSQDTAAVSVA